MQPHIDRIGSGKSQITRVESIRENVAALDGRLEILVACMPPEPVLLALSSDTRDPANPSFARPFPFKGAFFNADVCNEVMVRARAYGKPCMSSDGARWSDRNPDFDDVRGHYARDINQLHEALFHEPSDTERAFTLCQAGLFTRPRTRSLHCDGDAQDAQYFARIGALPLECISHRMLQSAPEPVLDLVSQGESPGASGFAARQGLRGMKILVPTELDAVYVSLGGERGTVHCSSEDIPPEGVHSAFFFALRSFALGAPRL